MGFQGRILRAFIFLSLTTIAPVASAQIATPVSVTARVASNDTLRTKVFKATNLIAPGVIIGSGLVMRHVTHDTWDKQIATKMQEWHTGVNVPPVDDYVQYLPLAMDLGLGLVGARTKHCFVDRTIEAAIGYLASAAMCWGLKLGMPTLRPNGADTHAFPSGHCCTAFVGAELVRMEYGAGWAIGSYGIASYVAASRMARNTHWFSDVVMGAGIGILSARIGGWLLEPVKNLFHIETTSRGTTFACVPAIDPFTGSYCASMSLAF